MSLAGERPVRYGRSLRPVRYGPPAGALASTASMAEWSAMLATSSKGARSPSPLAVFWVLLGLALVGVVVWRVTRVSGTEVAVLTLPGKAEFELGVGDTLRFTADVDVLFNDARRNARPEGCELRLTLEVEGSAPARASCDLFHTTGTTSVGGSAEYSTDSASGLRRLRVGGQRLGCELTAPAAGRAKLSATSTLATCVPRHLDATLQVYREP